MNPLILLRISKLGAALTHPICWRPLLFGVAPAVEHLDVLKEVYVDAILDVGANRGQFSLACRIRKRGVPIFAFEPIPEEAELFNKAHGRSPQVQLFQTALGPEMGTATLHLSGRADSSSLLPIGKAQEETFAGTSEVATITVPVMPLDGFLDHWNRFSDMLLKLDVQGFELKVLEGATKTLKKCRYVYAECSAKELYVGQALYPEVAGFLAVHGFELRSRHNEFWKAGELIQADYLFEQK